MKQIVDRDTERKYLNTLKTDADLAGLCEAVFDISLLVQDMCIEHHIMVCDSRDMFWVVYELAIQFYASHFRNGFYDFINDKPLDTEEYLEELYNYTEEALLSAYVYDEEEEPYE